MSTPFMLPAELTICRAVETRDALLAWVSEQQLKKHSQLEVSARQVSEVDGSGLQLLAALLHMDLTWRLVDASTAFSEACHALGLSIWLDKRSGSDARGIPS